MRYNGPSGPWSPIPGRVRTDPGIGPLHLRVAARHHILPTYLVEQMLAQARDSPDACAQKIQVVHKAKSFQYSDVGDDGQRRVTSLGTPEREWRNGGSRGQLHA